MNRMKILLLVVLAATMFVGCNDNGKKKDNELVQNVLEQTNDSVEDKAIYGRCGEGSSMHSLQLLTDAGDTLDIFIPDDEENGTQRVQGGLMSGDRIAVWLQDGDEELTAERVVNVTSLIGHWKSLDKDFEILEGGYVKNHLNETAGAWRSWQFADDGDLVLGHDTFKIFQLGADTLFLESRGGIYTYKREVNHAAL